MRYNYLETVKADVRDYIKNEVTLEDFSSRDDLEETLYDDLFSCDSVTGNASGSYYCNSWKAEEAVAHNWDLLAEAIIEFGDNDVNILEKGEEWADVTIRCYLLGQAISEVLDEMQEELEKVFADNEE